MRALVLVAAGAASLALAASSTAAEPPPWRAAGDVQLALSDAEAALVLGDVTAVQERLAQARLAARRIVGSDGSVAQEFAAAEKALRRGDETTLVAARSAIWTEILAAAADRATAATARGDVATARSWLLVR